MNIGILCYPTFGGSGIVATELGMELAKKGHQVHFISYSQPERLNIFLENIYFHQVGIQEYPLFKYQPYTLALSTKIVELTLNYKLDLIHVHYAIPHAYAAYMAKQILKEHQIDLPIITTLHGTDITLTGKHPEYKSAVKFSIEQSDVVTSVSESLRKDTNEIYEIKKEIKVVPNFINVEEYSPHIPCPRHNFAEKDEILLIHVSNFRKVKRIQDVIQIFYRVQKTVKSKLLMVGEGPEFERAEHLARTLGISDKVKFLGKTKDVIHILCFSDVFLLPSSAESFGLAALEAMASGVPVVSSNVGGIPEVNVNGYTGFLSNIGDVEDMAKNVLKIVESEQTLAYYKNNAKKHAYSFDYRNVLSQYEKIYTELTSSKD